ncbi:MAG: hypothetical protein HKN32_03655, partial [Flavobacteriales bacterium]|nr:hypothetical protein [Flavobacteriales bacterium]
MRRSIAWSKTFAVAFVVFSLYFPVLGQCDFEPSEKVLKLLAKSEDKKKYDSDKRYEFLEDALDEDDNCWPCIHKLGVLEFKRAKRGGFTFGSAESMLNRIAEGCPEYHSDPFY